MGSDIWLSAAISMNGDLINALTIGFINYKEISSLSVLKLE